MIELEAVGAAIAPADLAARIVAKAEAFQKLIGLAAGLRSKAKLAIRQATANQVPIDKVPSILEKVFTEVDAEVHAAIAQWRSGQS